MFMFFVVVSILWFGATFGSESVGDAPPVLPEPYPISFSVSFASNITSSSTTTHPISSLSPLFQNSISTKRQLNSHVWNRDDKVVYGKLYYDFGVPAQRIDHGPGSYECVKFYNHSLGCSLIFLKQGMYRMLHYKRHFPDRKQNHDTFNFYEVIGLRDESALDCCLDLEGIGPPPPDWASQANPTYDGNVFDDYSQLLSHQWTFNKVKFDTNDRDDSKGYHTKRQVVSGEYQGRPLLFTFPSAGGRQDMHYLVETMEVRAQQSEHFTIPNECINKRCGTKGS